jgi:hypothetical protein
MVSDRGDRCLFIFLSCLRLFLNVFPFPVCKAQLLGDWYEHRRGAPNTIIFPIIRQYYWRTNVPCANSNGGPNTKKKLLAHCVWSALPIGRGGHRCANILAHWYQLAPIVSTPVVRIGTPNPLTRRWVCPPPLVPGGGHTCLQERGWMGSQYEGTK